MTTTNNTTAGYIAALGLAAPRKAAVLALVDRLRPARRRWFQIWRWSDDARYRLAFELTNFMVQCLR